jgi:hypothetical protein
MQTNPESAAVEVVVFDRDAIFRSAEARAKLYALTLLVEGPDAFAGKMAMDSA